MRIPLFCRYRGITRRVLSEPKGRRTTVCTLVQWYICLNISGHHWPTLPSHERSPGSFGRHRRGFAENGLQCRERFCECAQRPTPCRKVCCVSAGRPGVLQEKGRRICSSRFPAQHRRSHRRLLDTDRATSPYRLGVLLQKRILRHQCSCRSGCPR